MYLNKDLIALKNFYQLDIMDNIELILTNPNLAFLRKMFLADIYDNIEYFNIIHKTRNILNMI